MSDDLLARATRALREETEAPGPSAAATRQRVVGALRATRARRAARLRIGALLVAAALGSTAWAAAGGHLQRASLWLKGNEAPRAGEGDAPAALAKGQQGSATSAPAEPVVPSTAVATEPSLPVDPTPAVDSAAPAEPAPSVELAPRVTPRASVAVLAAPARARAVEAPRVASAVHGAPAPSAVPSASAVAAAAASPVDAEAANDALYARAHALHFQAHDDAAALAAWDGYLQAAPRGRYAVVARYNRAMCLARLGRAVEAQAALKPFADAPEGGYRRAEARALLETLGGR